MAYYDLTGFFWWTFGVISTLLVLLLWYWTKSLINMREEYIQSLDDKAYRKYTTHLRRVQGFGFLKKGDK